MLNRLERYKQLLSDLLASGSAGLSPDYEVVRKSSKQLEKKIRRWERRAGFRRNKHQAEQAETNWSFIVFILFSFLIFV
jgi:hypothetical protein